MTIIAYLLEYEGEFRNAIDTVRDLLRCKETGGRVVTIDISESLLMTMFIDTAQASAQT